ncbi:MAG: FliO/MopB family protein [bacterium]
MSRFERAFFPLWVLPLAGSLACIPALARAAEAAPGGYLSAELGGMDATVTAQALQAPSLLPTLLNVVFSLAFVVALVLLAYWLLLKWRAKQGLAPGPRAGLIRVLERQFIDAKHGIAVVEVGGSVLTLGLGDDVSLLAEEADPTAVERLRQMAPLPASVMGFKEQLERVGLKLRKEEWGAAKKSLRDQSEELKAQTERVRGPRGGAR